MPQFSYKAKKGPQDVLNGVVDAATEEEAVDKLSQQGLVPVSIQELKTSGKKEENNKPSPSQPASPSTSIAFFGKIKSSEITIFSRQLATLLKSGVPILRAFWILSEQSENRCFKNFLATAQEEIKNGKTISEVLSKYPKPSCHLY